MNQSMLIGARALASLVQPARIAVQCTGVLLLSASLAYGQSAGAEVGPTAGVAITTLVGADTGGEESRTTAFFGGTLVLHPLGSILGFETGFIYVSKGASRQFEQGRGVLEVAYVDVPLLLRMVFDLRGTRIRPVLVLGGSLGFKAKCQLESTFMNTTVELDCEDPALSGTLHLNPIDLGISGGAGVDVPVGERLIAAPAVRYTRGLMDIGAAADSGDGKNAAFQIGVTVRLMLGSSTR